MRTNRPPVYASFPGLQNHVIDRQTKAELDRALRLFRKYSLRSNVFPYHWTKHNLAYSLGKKCTVLPVLFLLHVDADPAGEAVNISLATGEQFSLTELLSLIKAQRFPSTYLFLFVAEDIGPSISRVISEVSVPGLFLAVASSSYWPVLSLVGAYLTHWTDIASAYGTPVTHAYIGHCLETLLREVKRLFSGNRNEKLLIQQNVDSDLVVCKTGQVLLDSVDIDKVRNNAPHEEIADVVKRILDAARYTNPRRWEATQKINAQSVFWLCEISGTHIDFDWIRDTRICRDLSIAPTRRSTERIPLPQARTLNVPDLGQIMARFIDAPGGVYPIGNPDSTDVSEPPAPRHHRTIAPFRILQSPITNADWASVIGSVPTGDDGAVPRVYVSAFDALQYANILTAFARRAGLLDTTQVIDLPNEFQWECAARGKAGLQYPWGNKFVEGCCSHSFLVTAPTPVGEYSPAGDSPIGCWDMAGNVREWTRSYAGTKGVDWAMYDASAREVDIGSLDEFDRLVIRGGSYSYDPSCVRTWVRNTQIACRSDCQTGFRLVVERRL